MTPSAQGLQVLQDNAPEEERKRTSSDEYEYQFYGDDELIICPECHKPAERRSHAGAGFVEYQHKSRIEYGFRVVSSSDCCYVPVIAPRTPADPCQCGKPDIIIEGKEMFCATCGADIAYPEAALALYDPLMDVADARREAEFGKGL